MIMLNSVHDNKKSSLQKRAVAQEHMNAYYERVMWGQTHLPLTLLGAMHLFSADI